MANKKTKQKHKAAAADKASRQPKQLQNLGPRIKRTWRERQLIRCERTLRTLGALAKSLASGKPTGLTEQHGTNLAFAIGEIGTIGTVLEALPVDFAPKRAPQGSRTGVEVGSIICIAEASLVDPVFKFIPPAVYMNAEVLAEDGKQNWLVKCSDGSVRTVRKLYVEVVETDEATAEAPADDEDGELDDEDGEE